MEIGTVCNAYSNKIILSWQNGKYKRAIPLNQSNSPTIRSGPSYQSFEAYSISQFESTNMCQSMSKLTVYEVQETSNDIPLDELEDSEMQSQSADDELILWKY